MSKKTVIVSPRTGEKLEILLDKLANTITVCIDDKEIFFADWNDSIWPILRETIEMWSEPKEDIETAAGAPDQ